MVVGWGRCLGWKGRERGGVRWGLHCLVSVGCPPIPTLLGTKGLGTPDRCLRWGRRGIPLPCHEGSPRQKGMPLGMGEGGGASSTAGFQRPCERRGWGPLPALGPPCPRGCRTSASTSGPGRTGRRSRSIRRTMPRAAWGSKESGRGGGWRGGRACGGDPLADLYILPTP